MISSRRRAAVLALGGTILELVACAGSTETASENELAENVPALSVQRASKASAVSSEADLDEEPADAEHPNLHPSQCNYSDVEHCMRGHEGWRWVRRDEPPPRGGVIHEPHECCVLVGPERPGPTGAQIDLAVEDAHETKAESSPEAPTDCNFNDEWHCRRAHQGWRWLRRQKPPPRGGVINELRWCCVLVGPASEQWGYYR